MPTVTSGKVLITGVTGFIAGHIVQTLLQQNFTVRGTVRVLSKGQPLKEKLAQYGDKLEFVVVEDITKDGAFDEAVKGVDAIMHVASPCGFAEDPDEYIRPAVSGVVGVLESAKRCGDSVKRIVFTSSCAAIITVQPEFRVFTEDDWSEAFVQEVKEKGRGASPTAKYCASKILAERAAWAFMEEHKADIGFDLVALNPPWVIGPHLLLSRPEQLNTSMSMWWEVVSGRNATPYPGGEWVDVRDLAQVHVLAMEKEAAAGHRIIITAGPFQFEHWMSAAHAVDERLPASKPSAKIAYDYRLGASKATKLLAPEYRSLEETARDVVEQYRQLGWVA